MVAYLLGAITSIIVRVAHLTYLTQTHKFKIQSTLSVTINIKREISCEVYVAVKVHIVVSWVMIPCSVIIGY
jgi:hypothetical protein